MNVVVKNVSPQQVGLFALEKEADRLVVRPYDADQHGAIRGKSVCFERNLAGLRLRVGYFQTS
jgi:hypothetical protein